MSSKELQDAVASINMTGRGTVGRTTVDLEYETVRIYRTVGRAAGGMDMYVVGTNCCGTVLLEQFDFVSGEDIDVDSELSTLSDSKLRLPNTRAEAEFICTAIRKALERRRVGSGIIQFTSSQEDWTGFVRKALKSQRTYVKELPPFVNPNTRHTIFTMMVYTNPIRSKPLQ